MFINLFFLFIGVIIGIILMACVSSSSRMSFKEEMYNLYKEKK